MNLIRKYISIIENSNNDRDDWYDAYPHEEPETEIDRRAKRLQQKRQSEIDQMLKIKQKLDKNRIDFLKKQ